MSDTLLTVRIDDDTKEKFAFACDKMGLSMSTAVNIFAKKVASDCKIPFEVSFDPFESYTNQIVLKESISQLESGKVVVKTFEELRVFEDE